jgi:hypothetical protein
MSLEDRVACGLAMLTGLGRAPSGDCVGNCACVFVIFMAFSCAAGAAQFMTLGHLINDLESPVKQEHGDDASGWFHESLLFPWKWASAAQGFEPLAT